VLRDEGLKQILNLVGDNPLAGCTLLSSQITSLKPRRIDLLGGDLGLVQRDMAVRPDRVLAQPGPGATGAIKDDEDLAPLE
jgi:hypothetical protein